MINKLFSLAMDIGEQMLISGAEVYRVVESISRICHALGANRVDVFIITSSMVVTVTIKKPLLKEWFFYGAGGGNRTRAINLGS